MLSNAEYAHANNCPIDIAPAIAECLLFTIDMAETLMEGCRDKMFPDLPPFANHSLWGVKPYSKKRDSLRRKIIATRKEQEAARQANLAKYVERGYAFETPDSIDMCDD